MTVRTVNGTSIQAAIDASAPSGDEVVVRDVVAYKGFNVTKSVHVRAESGRVRVTSPLTLPPAGSDANVINMNAAGAKLTGFDVSGAMGKHGAGVSMVAADQVVTNVVSHDHERGYAFRVYGAAAVRPKLINVEAHHAALGIFIDGGGADGLVENPVIHHIDRMLVNDPTANNDTGGQAMGFKRNNGLVTVTNPQFDRNYSVKRTTGPDAGEPASWDYGWDGAQFELYESGPVLIQGGSVFGSPIVVETGRSSTGLECRDFTMRGTEVWGEWPGAIPADPNQAGLIRSNKGFLLRTAVNFTFEDLQIHDMDYWIVSILTGGGYGGTVSGLRVRNNEVWLKPGTRWISWNAGVPFTAVTEMTGNRVYPPSQGAVVAEVAGKGTTNDRAVFQGWTGHEATSYWGPETAPDPCAQVTAERDVAIAATDAALAQLATANAALSVANAELGSMTAQRDAANAKLTQAKSLAAQITAL